MNPWLILLELLGWGLLSLVALSFLLIAVGLIIAPFKRGKRAHKDTPILKGKRNY